MPVRGPLYWVDGEGWLVLVGGGDWRRGDTDQIDAEVLALANLDRPMLVMLAEGARDEAEGLLEHYMSLGGTGGEVLLLSEMKPQHFQSPKLLSLLDEVGILYLAGEDPAFIARSLQNTPVIERILKGFVTLQGLVLVGSGGAAAALGAWVKGAEPTSPMVPGLGFVRNAIVAPHFTRTEEAAVLRAQLQTRPEFLGLGIPDGAALALGPRGEVKPLGQGDVTAVVHASPETLEED